jgi:hypothetical protein
MKMASHPTPGTLVLIGTSEVGCCYGPVVYLRHCIELWDIYWYADLWLYHVWLANCLVSALSLGDFVLTLYWLLLLF